jgi:FkbM family methyltransferase
MSIGQKLLTASNLVARGQWSIIDRQIRLHWRTRQLHRSNGQPFIHRTAGPALVCFPDVPDSVEQFLQGGDDPWERALLRRWLQSGDTFVDAGANLGLYTHAVAGHFGDEVRVLALEASPHLVARLVRAAELLQEKNIKAVQVAVGASRSEVVFYLARPGKTTVSQSMRVDPADAADYEAHTLPMRPLAELVAEHIPHARVQLVKIDVEGAEPLALRGAAPEWLRADGPLWLVEINLPVLARMGFQPGDVTAFFAADRFQRWLLPKYPRKDGATPRPRELQNNEAFEDAAFYNFVAVPRGETANARRSRIRDLFP